MHTFEAIKSLHQLQLVLWMLEKSGTLLKVPCYQVADSQKTWAYVFFDSLPPEPHVSLVSNKKYTLMLIISLKIIQSGGCFILPD